MLTVEDFIIKFDKYSDQELFNIFQNIEDYSNEAKTALNHVVDKKGGIGRLKNSIEQKEQMSVETKRIQKEIYQLGLDGFDEEFMRKTISSTILSNDRLNEIINEYYVSSIKDIEDKKVDMETIRRCVMAGVVATSVSGSSLGILFIYTNVVHILVFAGVAMLCYAIIKGIVKKSKNNNAVIVTTLVSTVFAIGLGFLLFNFFS